MTNLDLLAEMDTYDVKELGKRLVTNPSRPTIYRWIRKGVVVNGKTIKLRAVRIGKTFVTSEQAVSEFLRQQNEG
ncbi:hypothetical protein N9248_02350 [bacterium]|nr:hypothetical protein [bacterium]